jgi:hypothetical protein
MIEPENVCGSDGIELLLDALCASETSAKLIGVTKLWQTKPATTNAAFPTDSA